jgi:dimethylamine/trimethylamine dehydrogenase
VSCVGDALAPGTVAAAVHGGHRAARELDLDIDPDAVPFRREWIAIDGLA